MPAASRIIAYEPSTRSLEVLRANVDQNGLGHVVVPHQAAVTKVAGGQVRFPLRASMYNRVMTGDGTPRADFEWVPTISLAAILAECGAVDILKLDCEGCEYDVLFGSGAEVFERIQRIRLEYHNGRHDELARFLSGHGFVRRRWKADAKNYGTMWFDRAQ
jgi:FkbM family methyltransferase